MDTLQMSYLLTLTKENYNITKTAKRLYITQAALSKSIHNVEEKLGVQLFQRENGRLVDLSPAGKVFIERVRQILDTYDIMCEELSVFSGEISGSVKIGIPNDIVNVLFYRSFPKLIMDYPSVHLDLYEGISLELEHSFTANDLDILIALDYNQDGSSEYERALLASQPYGVILDKKHPLANCKTITWDHLKDYPLALPTRSYTRMLVLSKLMKRQITPKIAINAFSSHMLICSVRHSQIITILPQIFFNSSVREIDHIIWLPMADPINWNLEIRMKKRHRELGDTVCHIFDRIKNTNYTPELSSCHQRNS
ncbi:LysR family transcriptional regulator [Clostridiales bacterium COT073_COT-073]|nr:LysR family transcriptional regulator [Clostridiales bacterium COT073_COT-073]